MEIGEKLKKLRKDLRYTQEAMAELMGISQTAVSQYELGQREPSFSVLKKYQRFAKANKVKIKFLED